MKNFHVYSYKDNLYEGEFLNIETTPLQGVKIWYLNEDGEIVYAFREEVYLKSVPLYGPATG